jgi:acyl-CoA dehydrogenase
MIPDPPDQSYWEASPHLRCLVQRKLEPAAWEWARPQLERMGELSAKDVAPRAQVADREQPRLASWDPQGRRINRVDYHPAYREMERIAYGSGMIAMKYTPHEHSSSATLVGFALGYLFAMGEMGLYCPLCMTDGVARVLTRFGTPEQIARVVPRLAATDRESLWTGAMFLTERAGGSDVGSNETVARRAADGSWRLTGQKWFCSNADADAALVTARPEGAPAGTRGLRTFLLLTGGNPGVTIDRLKEKLGVRSMPTGEVTLADAPAEEVGGFAATVEMLNLSRLYNSVAAVAVIGRAVHEARWYVERRNAFGRPVIEWPLARETMADLEAEHVAALLLTFEAVDALRRADTGDADAARLLRILTPIVKQVTGKLAVPCVSEAMELIGGNGYIEENPLPRLLRDAQVLPIWEGTTNVLSLDALRVLAKPGIGDAFVAELERLGSPSRDQVAGSLAAVASRDPETAQASARRLAFELAEAWIEGLLREAALAGGREARVAELWESPAAATGADLGLVVDGG